MTHGHLKSYRISTTLTDMTESILKGGLNRGDVPVSPTEAVNAVWLTTDTDPEGHGLTDGRALTDKERLTYASVFGRHPPEGARFPNKRAVRIKLLIPNSDRQLIHWPKWARKKLDRDWYRVLDETGGRKSSSWYLYLGCIVPERFLTIDQLATG